VGGTRAGVVLPHPVRPRKSWLGSVPEKSTLVGRRLTVRDEVPFAEVGLQVVLPPRVNLIDYVTSQEGGGWCHKRAKKFLGPPKLSWNPGRAKKQLLGLDLAHKSPVIFRSIEKKIP
jgi:hypothetical protein